MNASDIVQIAFLAGIGWHASKALFECAKLMVHNLRNSNTNASGRQ